jgi:glycopeptide antibiotics resistance protein
MDRWRLALLGTYVAAILVVTLQPLGEHIYGAVTLTSGLRDFDGSFNPIGAVKNVALFVPLGVIFESTQVSGGGRFRRVMLGVLALSVSIETLQFLFVPGRAADLSDLVSNVVGFAIGFGSQHRLRTHLWASKAD